MRRVALFALLVALVVPSFGALPASAVGSVEYDDMERTDTDVEVFMKVAATPSQIADVRKAIRSDRDILRYAYLDHDDALAEFARIFRRNTELRGGVGPEDLPVSFRLDVRRGRRDAVARRYASLPGVDETLDGRSNRESAWSVRLACSRTAYDLEVVMEADATPEQLDAAVIEARASNIVEDVEIANSDEVAAIFKCAKAAGAPPLLEPPPSAIVHVDVDDPAGLGFEMLRSAIVDLPGVAGVLWDPEAGGGTPA